MVSPKAVVLVLAVLAIAAMAWKLKKRSEGYTGTKADRYIATSRGTKADRYVGTSHNKGNKNYVGQSGSFGRDKSFRGDTANRLHNKKF